ncbi:aminotransferase class I/II-fold pyridoxal phosphate-dependent enzyme [Cellulophaga baltica]|uniref:aminotransferase class I/II-fold pyridoxal phosphate-dependent enzyme n=1 Tax=Cellulophaga TaxID=104264 RepID=UPI001C06A498|nr:MULTISPECIES: aminotransferase class I/II-fold pyridoxal phosphate-dependent enzyme [Cellulophaga]MBU2997889.1 aminotransferase class I/II-fold pyridoxal phosphate-dependent enzyme [Cellulophaga baltica]MDO6769290.1 aminotransferase class I/II-fold pyridoxal phosphate-dependent enzyme [Cellulophaga sp. 1_MG-2023]
MKHTVTTFPGREIKIEDKNYLYFGGTAYLGLQTDRNFQDIYIQNILKYGTNYGASRKSNIQIAIFDKAENYLANLVGSESCTTMSSGYLAGQFVTQAFANKTYKLFYAPNTHSALYQTKQKSKKASSYVTFSSLNFAVRHHLEKNKKAIPVIFLDAIDFSGVNYPNFEGLAQLPLSQLILVVDDSHGIGIVGENGSGVFKKIASLNPKELIVSCSLGKGFGVQSGAIFGTSERITNLTETEFYGGASPASPANIASIIDGQEVFTIKRKQLQENIELFLKHVTVTRKFHFMNGHPAFSFQDEELTAYLEQHHIIVTSFRYPNKDSKLMSRIVISAAHTKDDILELSNVLNKYL